jgi:hypothetical protein
MDDVCCSNQPHRDEVCFVSVAFGSQYVQQQHRLKDSIKEIYPKANIRFWLNELPKGSKPFLDSLYGFKVHAIKEVKDEGFKKIIWLDPAMILTGKVDKLLSFPLVAVRDDSVLHNVVSNKTLDFFRLTRDQIRENGWHLVGGSLYFFDFNTEIANTVFDMWFHTEIGGLFGSQQEAASEQLQGHRYDETLFALAMYLNGYAPQRADEVGYCISENSIFQKKHFK